MGDAEKPGLPILLEIAGRPVVVIGGGADAADLASTLVEHGAAVTVVAASASIPMHALAAEELIALLPREYVRGDLADACFAACFESGEVAAAVTAEAAAERCPLAIPAHPALSTATVVDRADPPAPA